MNIDFTGKTALVTGGSRGIGKQIVEDMVSLGAKVITTSTKPQENSHPNIKFYTVDFKEQNSTEKFLEFISTTHIDICINNAGINKIDSIVDIKFSDWEDILEVNLSAPFKIIQAVSKKMIQKKYGKIVNISSIWGNISIAKRACYSSTKFGLRGLTLATAAELAQYNVLVNTVSPGFTLTDLTRKVLGEDNMNELSKKIPMKRFATTSEVSKTVLFLASDLNSYISGQDIVVDGGFINV
tara:strand:+ start:5118 stop:5837 length:720 start_codon:yes stop_codon:yes gene_type:complete